MKARSADSNYGLRFFVLLCCLSWAIGAILGCRSLDRALYNERPALQTNEALRIVTNTPPPVVVVITNERLQLVTNVVQLPPVVELVTNRELVIVTNLVAKPEIETAIVATGSVPVPWAGLAGGVAGWLYTGYMAVRNRKLAVALVQGIEEGRKLILSKSENSSAELDGLVKEALVDSQLEHGVLPLARKLVASHTSDTHG